VKGKHPSLLLCLKHGGEVLSITKIGWSVFFLDKFRNLALFKGMKNGEDVVM
jgi:hypothetical protein